MGKYLGFAALLAAALPAGQAHAAVLSFTGFANSTAVTAVDPTCAPIRFRGFANGSGNSSLGAFTYFHNACTEGAKTPVSLSTGIFEMTFALGAINGRFEGASIPRSDTPGLFDQDFMYTILGGTGEFLGASGGFRNLGTVDTRGGPPGRLAYNFDGFVDAPGVPEPGSWAMLILGFFAVGAGLRAYAKPAPDLSFSAA